MTITYLTENDETSRPDHEREHPQHVDLVDRDACGRVKSTREFAYSGLRPDVAIDDAQRGEAQGGGSPVMEGANHTADADTVKPPGATAGLGPRRVGRRLWRHRDEPHCTRFASAFTGRTRSRSNQVNVLGVLSLVDLVAGPRRFRSSM